MRSLANISTRHRKYFANAIGFVGVAIWFWSGWFSGHLMKTRPATPLAASQQTYPLKQHGKVVYLTSREFYFLYGMQTSGFVLLVVGMGLYAYWYRGDQALNRELGRRRQ